MLVYPSGVDVSSSTLRFLAEHLRGHRHAINSRWRSLSAGRQALLALVHLRRGHTYSQLAAGFGVGTTTAYRYVTEAVDLLATLAPTLADAVRTASTKAFVLLDGTLLPIDRIAANRPFYSGKHKKHGMNVQVLTDAFGRLLWASPALPGAVHDVRGEHGIIDALAQTDVAEGTTPLYAASVTGATDNVLCLLAAGALPNTESGRGTEGTPLCAAACWGHTETVIALLARGADPDLREDHGTGRSPLEWAMTGPYPETIAVLLDAGARPRSRAT